MKTYTVTIQGVAPLLMHRMDAEAQAEISREGEAKVKAKKKDYGTIEQQAERGAYRLENGNLYLPGEAIYQAMVKAGAAFAVKGARGATYKGVVQGSATVTPDYIDLGVSEYAVDARTVRVQRNASMRYRPRLDEWQATFSVEVFDEDALPGEVLNAILQRAGQAVGILDYRPRFGRFMVTRFGDSA
jgi:hypothetical protein